MIDIFIYLRIIYNYYKIYLRAGYMSCEKRHVHYLYTRRKIWQINCITVLSIFFQLSARSSKEWQSSKWFIIWRTIIACPHDSTGSGRDYQLPLFTKAGHDSLARNFAGYCRGFRCNSNRSAYQIICWGRPRTICRTGIFEWFWRDAWQPCTQFPSAIRRLQTWWMALNTNVFDNLVWERRGKIIYVAEKTLPMKISRSTENIKLLKGNLRFGVNNLAVKNSINILVVEVASRFSYRRHLEGMAHMVSLNVTPLCHVRHVLNPYSYLSLSKAQMRPVIQWSSFTWISSAKYHLSLLGKVRRQAERLITQASG